MIDLIALVTEMAATLQRVPPLVAILALPTPEKPGIPIVPYVDLNPTQRSVSKARYQIQPGSVLIAWEETIFRESQSMAWSHIVQIFVKALPQHSSLEMVHAIVNGVPIPGDGLPWRFCPIMDGVLPTNVTNIVRTADDEGIDYVVITTETSETGDFLP